MERRKKLQRIKRRALLQALSEQEALQSKPAKASDYLHHLADYYKQHPDMQAIIICRVSACMQAYKLNLNTYEKLLRRKLKKRNIPVVGCFREVSSGWILDSEKRHGLTNAVKQAKDLIENGKDMVIVAASADRFLRNKYYTTNKPNILPTEEDYGKLKELTCNVPLLTLLDPDMPPMEVRGYQTRWGQKTKRSKGGRPRKKVAGYKKIQREQKLGIVLKLWEKGKKISEIAYKTGTKLGTINDWIVKYG
jgi:hypothetical protein